MTDKYPAPLSAPGRTLNLRAGATFVTGVQWPGSGYNARTVGGVQYDPEEGWPDNDRPSEHAYTAAYDFMITRFGVSLAHQRREGDKLAEWLVMIGTDKRYRATYGYVNTVIWNRRIWTWARRSEGWRRYTGRNPHTDHVHADLWCPELEAFPL